MRAVNDPDGRFADLPEDTQNQPYEEPVLKRSGRNEAEKNTKPQKNIHRILLLLFACIAVLFTLFMIGRAIWQFSKDDMVAVPNLTGKTSAEAEIELANLSISVSFAYQPNDTVAEGVVYGQSVSPDTPVAPKTLVTVYVSSGPEKINVPSVCNMSIAEAEARLDEAGLELGTTSFQPNTEEIEGTVIRQVPAAGETVAKGSEVNLVIVSNQTPTGTAVPGE